MQLTGLFQPPLLHFRSEKALGSNGAKRKKCNPFSLLDEGRLIQGLSLNFMRAMYYDIRDVSFINRFVL